MRILLADLLQKKIFFFCTRIKEDENTIDVQFLFHILIHKKHATCIPSLVLNLKNIILLVLLFLYYYTRWRLSNIYEFITELINQANNGKNIIIIITIGKNDQTTINVT